MFRNLVIILAIVAIAWIVSGMLRRARPGRKNTPGKGKDMVQCEQCGTYLPGDDAINMNGRFFCGQQHLQDWKDKH